MSVYDKSERALRPVAYEALHLDLWQHYNGSLRRQSNSVN